MEQVEKPRDFFQNAYLANSQNQIRNFRSPNSQDPFIPHRFILAWSEYLPCFPRTAVVINSYIMFSQLLILVLVLNFSSVITVMQISELSVLFG